MLLFTRAHQRPTVPKLLMEKNRGTTYVVGRGVGRGAERRRWLRVDHPAGLWLQGVSGNEELPGSAAAPPLSLSALVEPKAKNAAMRVSLPSAACFGHVTETVRKNHTETKNTQPYLPCDDVA